MESETEYDDEDDETVNIIDEELKRREGPSHHRLNSALARNQPLMDINTVNSGRSGRAPLHLNQSMAALKGSQIGIHDTVVLDELIERGEEEDGGPRV